MRYEDASQSGSSNNQSPVARDDADALPAGDRGPATGNVITGAGTISGSAGADLGAEHAHVVSIRGAHGSDSSFTGGKLAVDGQFGHLSMDAEGNYAYLANKGAPENSRDTFNYKLADAAGHDATATLTVEIGKSPAVVHADAQRMVPGPDGVVVLPAGVQLTDVHAIGRDLVVDLPGGGQMLIVDGAIFVPQLVFGDVEVPATSLAALLIGSEIRPAAGDALTGLAQSSGGNFEVPVAPLDPGIALGDLIPPTALAYVPPDFREVLLVENSHPSILIETPDQPAGAENATARVDESALPARGSEPAGTNSASTAETTVGTIVYTSPDAPNSISVGGVVIVAVGQVIAGTYGNLTITSIADGAIGYSYTLADNSLGDTTSDVFTVVITDRDGDQDTATLTVSIIDDAPIARADADSVTEDGPLVADGNVLTGIGGHDANATDGIADTPGADGFALTGIAFGGTIGALGAPLAGAYGSLVIGADGNYVYTLNNQSSAVQALGVNHTLTETFTYTVTDGDGDARSTTLTITINGANDAPTISSGAAIVSEEGLASGNPDSVGLPSDSSNSATTSGQLAVSDVDNDALTVRLGVPAGALTSHGQAIGWAVSSDGHVLTGSANGATVITVTIANNGAYTVALSGQVDHPNTAGEDILAFGVPVTVGDGTATTAATLTVSVEDDSPIITSGPVAASSVTIDETDGSDPLSAGPPVVVTSSGAIISTGVSFGADGPGTATVYGLSLQGGTSVASGLQTALGDQPITLTLTSSTLITGTYNGGTQTAFTIQMNANGSVTVTLNTALEHLVDGSTPAAYDDVLSLVVGGVSLVNATATYTDFDGDRVTGTVGIGGAILFRDDGPSIDVTANANIEAGVLLTTGDDGTEGAGFTTASTSSGAFGGTFGLTFATGADGAATPSLSFALAATTGVSGLSSHGVAINLYNVGGVIVGSTALVAPPVGDASIVFAVSVDAAGIVTLTQYSQIDHALQAGSNNAPFADQLTSLADGVITLTASSTIVDNDGDSASDSATINIGANLRFADDGPAIAATLVNGATIRIDETDGVAAAGGEVDPIGGNLGTVTMAATSLFTVSTLAPSADAPTTLAYALSVSAPGVASGLLLSTTNEAIVLVNNNGVIEGHVANPAGAIAFTVSINAATGATTLTQFLAVEHFNTASNDEDSSALTAGVLTVNVTATDYDGDTAVASVDLGSIIRFEDDGPSIDVTANANIEAGVLLTTGDDGTEGAGFTTASTSSGAFGGTFGLTFATGADGAATPSLSFALAATTGVSGLSSHGVAINLYNVGGVIVGSTALVAPPVGDASIVFAVSVDAAGIVTLTQYSQIDHALQAGSNNAPFADQLTSLADGVITLTASSTIVDNDGDSASDSATINIGANLRFADDGPAIAATLVNGATIRIDETDGVAAAGGEVDPIGGNLGTVTMAATSLFTVSTLAPSADAPTTLAYALSVSAPGVASGLLLSTTNEAIVLVNNNGVIEGHVANPAGAIAFTVSINAATGATTLTQFLAVEHFNTASNDEDSSALTAGVLTVNVTATDYDGDTAVASVDLGSIIRFEDDGPSIDVTANANIEAGVLLTTGDDGTEGAGFTTASTSSGAFGGTFGLTFATGADGAATPSLSFALAATTGVSGLSSHGVAINLYNVGGVIVGSTALVAPPVGDASIVFAVSVDAAGIVTLTQYSQIDHALQAGSNNAPFADQLTSLADGVITLTASSTIVDNDGDSASDSATINIGANLRFADDGPAIAATLVNGATIRIDETDGVAAAGGEVDPIGGNLGTVTMAATSLFTVSTLAPSADAPTTLAYALSVSAPGVASGLLLSTTNEAIVLVNNNGVIEGHVANPAGAIAFTVSINAATGATTLTQFLAVEHFNTASNDEDSSALTAGVLTVNVTATDYDGDTAVASVDLGSIIRFEDDGPSINIVENSGPSSTIVEGGTFSGTWTLAPGSDGVTSVHVVYDATNGNLSLAPGSTLVLSDAAGTLTVNANGTYSFAATAGTDQTVINSATFTLSAVDNDGDPTQDSLTISITDAPQSVDAAPITLVVDEAALGTAGATGSNPGSPNEVDNSPALSFTAGVDALTSFAFSTDLSHLVTDLNLTGGQDIFWTRVNATTIVGSLTAGGPAAITLSLSAPASIASGTTGAVTVTVTLADNLPHELALGAQTAGLGFVLVNASESDGDTATGQVNVQVIDDVPSLNIVENSGASSTVVEGGTFNGTWTLTPGADGVTSVHVVYDAISGNLSLAPGSTLVLSDAAGTLTVNANGTYSFAAAPGTDQTVVNSASFTLSAVDGDGDPTQDSLTISITDGPPAGNAAPITLVVDEAALGTAGATGSNPASPNEVDNSPALSFLAGSDALTSFAFSTDLSHLVTDLNLTGGQDIFWTRVNATTIVGSLTAGGPAAITLSLSAPASIAAGTSGAVTVTVTLADNLPHELALGAQTAGLGFILVNASDHDGDTATGQVNVQVVDDVPTLNIVENTGATSTIVEGGTFNGTWTLTPGADGVTSVHVVYDATSGNLSLAPGSTLVLSDVAGTLTVNANGTYSFAAAPGTDQTVVNSASFTLSAVDGDGDPTQDSLTISITDGPPAGNAAPITLVVDEAALDTAAATGTNPASPNEVDNSPALSFTAGSDALTAFAFSTDLSHLVTDLNLTGGQDIYWTRVNATTIIGSLTSGGAAAITLSLSAPASIAAGAIGAVTMTVTLADNLPHELALGAQTAGLGYVLVTASDHDGDTATGQVNVQVTDDVPLAFSPVDLVDQNNSTGTPQDNALVNDGNAFVTRLINDGDNDGVGTNFIGADGFGSLTFTGGVNGGQLLSDAAVPLTSGGSPIYVFGWGTGVLTATTDATNTSATAVVFTATLTPGTGYGATSTYTLDFNHTVDDGSGFIFSNFSTAPAGQNQWIGLDSDGNAINVDNNNSHDILISATAGGTVNTSASDIGSNNQWIDGGEGIRLDFVTDVRYGSGDEKVTGGYNFDGHYTITDASFEVIQGGPASIQIHAVRDTDSGTLTTLDGSTVAIDLTSISVTNAGVVVPASGYTVYDMGDGTVVITGLDAGDTVNFDTNGSAFNAVIVTSAANVLNPFTPSPTDTFGGGHFSLGAFGFNTASSGHPIDLTFNVTATDSDGDTSTGTIDVTLVPVAITPVALDTNHDGHIDFLGVNAGVLYDTNGDGHANATAWVGGGDSILVRDADGNGTVTNASEFVFGANGQTDLAALHAQYGDQLDANDADFSQFMAWNDANANGIVDAGELHSLSELGIVSINLVSDGVASSAAGGDVSIAGSGSFTYVNDNGAAASGLLADAAFRTVERDIATAQRFGTAANSAAIVTAAVAAMGLAATQAAATVHDDAPRGFEAAAPIAESTSAGLAGTSASVAATASASPLAAPAHASAAAAPTSSAANHAPAPEATLTGASDHAGHEGAEVTGLLAASAPVADTAAPAMPMIVMPAIAAFDAAPDGHDVAGAKAAVTVQSVLTEVLAGGASGGAVDAVLAALPAHGGGPNPALEALASQPNESVSAWDMSPAGHLAAATMANIMTDMTAFHHDAVQPAVNG